MHAFTFSAVTSPGDNRHQIRLHQMVVIVASCSVFEHVAMPTLMSMAASCR